MKWRFCGKKRESLSEVWGDRANLWFRDGVQEWLVDLKHAQSSGFEAEYTTPWCTGFWCTVHMIWRRIDISQSCYCKNTLSLILVLFFIGFFFSPQSSSQYPFQAIPLFILFPSLFQRKDLLLGPSHAQQSFPLFCHISRSTSDLAFSIWLNKKFCNPSILLQQPLLITIKLDLLHYIFYIHPRFFAFCWAT